MQRLTAALLVACVAPALAQDTGKLFDRLVSKDDAEAQAAHSELVALGEAVVPELERRLGKKPPERVAARLRAVLAAIQVGDLEALLTPRLELPGSAAIPAVISPDGKHVAYVARILGDNERTFEYRVATLSADGALKVKTLHACTEGTRDDYVVPSLRPGCWSPDSRYLGYMELGAGGPKQVVTGYLDVKSGEATVLGEGEREMHLSVRFHPKGGQVAWLKLIEDGNGVIGNVQLRELKSGATRALELPEGFAPVDLRYLEDGRALVLGMQFPQRDANAGPQRPVGRLCLVSADEKTVTLGKQEVVPDDFFWDGPPLLLHAPGGDAVLCESRNPETGRKRPSQVWRLGLKDADTKLLIAESSWTPVGMFDTQRASVWAHDRSSAGVLNVETGEVTPFEHKRLLLHRRGERAVLLDMETRKLWIN